MPRSPLRSADGVPRVGFLGAGLIATFHSKMLRRSDVACVRSGVYDPDRERAEVFAAASGCPVLADEDELIEASDAVYVCTWTSEHARLVRAAAAAGRAVFCEKPLAVDLATAEEMLDVVTRADVVHQVGLILRRSPAFLVARDLVRDPGAGAVMAAVLRDDQFIPTQGMYASTWRSDRELAGAGTLLEHSIHDVDLLRQLVGEVRSVSARLENHHGHDGIEDVVVATICFAGGDDVDAGAAAAGGGAGRPGALGTLTSVWHDNLARPSLRRVEVLCERRHVVVDGDDWYGPVTWTDADGRRGELAGADLVARAATMVDHSLHPDADFIRAVRDGRPADPDLSVAVAAHRIVDAMYRSAHDGGRPVEVGA